MRIMPQIALAVLLAFSAGSSSAQERTSKPSTARFVPNVRSIRVELIAASEEGLTDIPFQTLQKAWKSENIALSVETPLDVQAVDQARKVIKDLYAQQGRSVRVEQQIDQIPPGSSVQVAFRVIELCFCNR